MKIKNNFIFVLMFIVFNCLYAQQYTVEKSTSPKTSQKEKSWWEIGARIGSFIEGEAASFEMHNTYPDVWIRFPKDSVHPNGWFIGINRVEDVGTFEKRNALYPGGDVSGNEFLLSKFYKKKYGLISIKNRIGKSQGSSTGLYAGSGLGQSYRGDKSRTFIFGSTVNYYPVKYIGIGIGYELLYYYYKTWLFANFTPLEISDPWKISGWVAFPMSNIEIRVPVKNFSFGVETWQYIIGVNDVKASSWYSITTSYKFGIKK